MTSDISNNAVAHVLSSKTHDLGGFTVQRVLPARTQKMVGPFIFWDQMGPGQFIAGNGIDVRPHPHIGLSTVTYLFEGSLDHKDSLGNRVRIVPGELNIMTAGRGIVHSERTGKDVRATASTLYGIQSWLAQPRSVEQGEPGFIHLAQDQLPKIEKQDWHATIILGEAFGQTSPTPTQWKTIYVDMHLQPGASITLPYYQQRAIYILEGTIEMGGASYQAGQMVTLQADHAIEISTQFLTHIMLLGGDAMDGDRHIWWNFVASDPAMIEEAKERWQTGQFPIVPGDQQEFIPLPT
ncbi:MAG: pirin family protein [Deltaproteobacteria bacterium]|nr:pirin family protein [Deltaproteobacteria bacterium]